MVLDNFCEDGYDLEDFINYGDAYDFAEIAYLTETCFYVKTVDNSNMTIPASNGNITYDCTPTPPLDNPWSQCNYSVVNNIEYLYDNGQPVEKPFDNYEFAPLFLSPPSPMPNNEFDNASCYWDVVSK